LPASPVPSRQQNGLSDSIGLSSSPRGLWSPPLPSLLWPVFSPDPCPLLPTFTPVIPPRRPYPRDQGVTPLDSYLSFPDAALFPPHVFPFLIPRPVPIPVPEDLRTPDYVGPPSEVFPFFRSLFSFRIRWPFLFSLSFFPLLFLVLSPFPGFGCWFVSFLVHSHLSSLPPSLLLFSLPPSPFFFSHALSPVTVMCVYPFLTASEKARNLRCHRECYPGGRTLLFLS